jgi:hypothetical protein
LTPAPDGRIYVLDVGNQRIAVDDEGFIYVWDPGNKRIQVFAP